MEKIPNSDGSQEHKVEISDFEDFKSNALHDYKEKLYMHGSPDSFFVMKPERQKQETKELLSHLGMGCVLAFQIEGGGEIQVFDNSYKDESDLKMGKMGYFDQAKYYSEHVEEGETVKISPESVTIHTENILKWKNMDEEFETEGYREGDRQTLVKYV